MRRLALFSSIAACALAACSQEAGRETYGEPEVAPSSAPGVAFRFSYDYALDDERISAVQEAHAADCEKLGPATCRITGLRYNIDHRKRVSGMLQVKLDPQSARQFGRQATRTVAQNDGELVRSEFTGDDVGQPIAAGQDRQADLQSRIAGIERRLASLNAGDREATQLQAQLQELRNQLAAARSEIAQGRQLLASTPMTFNYFGEGGIAGFDENPLKASFRLMVESTVAMVSIVLKVIGAVLPWALLLLVVVAIARSSPARSLRRWWTRFAPRPKEES